MAWAFRSVMRRPVQKSRQGLRHASFPLPPSSARVSDRQPQRRRSYASCSWAVQQSIDISTEYDVVHDKAYDIGKAFAFMNCYDMVCERFPAPIEPNSVGTTVIGTIRGGSPLDTTEDAVDAYTEDGRENE
jgi:hypothetical protein